MENPVFNTGARGYSENKYPDWLEKAASELRVRENLERRPGPHDGNPWGDGFFKFNYPKLIDHPFCLQYGEVIVWVTAPYHDSYGTAKLFADQMQIELLSERGDRDGGYWIFAFAPKGTPKPCPFCSGIPTHVVGDREVRQPDVVMCGCGATIEEEYEPYSALNKWNTRKYYPRGH